jgi:hypothetical protein
VPFTDEPQTGDAANPIVALDITDVESFEALDPTGRRAMEQQFMNRPEAEAKEAQRRRPKAPKFIKLQSAQQA